MSSILTYLRSHKTFNRDELELKLEIKWLKDAAWESAFNFLGQNVPLSYIHAVIAEMFFISTGSIL